MKKKLFWGLLLIVGFIVLFTSKSSVTLQLPFMQSDVVNIEMYHYEGVPAAEECKIVTVREDINTLHKELQNIKIRDRKKDSEPMTGCSVTKFIFVLSDGTEYDLEYSNSGETPTISSKAGGFTYQTLANLEKYWTKLEYEIVKKEPEMLSIAEYNKQYAAKEDAKVDNETKSLSETYKDALYQIREHHILPDGIDYGYDQINDLSENSFAVYDIDNDGKDELLISYWTTSMAGNVLKIYDYDEKSGKLNEEFSEFPSVTFYSNGVIEAAKSHNHGLASMSEDFWPYALYQYDSESDKYAKIADVDAWEKEYQQEYEGIPFPTDEDIDKDGCLYYLMENNLYEYKSPLDNKAYEKWRESYLEEAEEISIEFLKMTDENIEGISERCFESGYSDEELKKMACNYMTKETSWEPGYYEIESDNTAFRIWFYDVIMDAESSHGVTRGRFEINRETGIGEDSNTFEKIDFSKYFY